MAETRSIRVLVHQTEVSIKEKKEKRNNKRKEENLQDDEQVVRNNVTDSH
jgi:hypothetical protein